MTAFIPTPQVPKGKLDLRNGKWPECFTKLSYNLLFERTKGKLLQGNYIHKTPYKITSGVKAAQG